MKHLSFILILMLTLVSSPASASRFANVGQVHVQNLSGVSVTVTLPGNFRMRLAPGQSRILSTTAGRGTVLTTFNQFGSERLLESEYVTVVPGRTSRVIIEPAMDARILVTNRSRQRATLELDGRAIGHLMPGESQLVATNPGRTHLALVTRRGFIVDSTVIHARPHVDHIFNARDVRIHQSQALRASPRRTNRGHHHRSHRVMLAGR